jgi:hypothetical protein
VRVSGAGIEQLTFSWEQEILTGFLGISIGIGALVQSAAVAKEFSAPVMACPWPDLRSACG